MLLGRLRIQGKLALLLTIPILSLIGLAVPVVVNQVGEANRAANTAQSIQVAGRVGSVIQDLQRERLLSVGHLLGTVDRSRLLLQTARMADRIAELHTDLDGVLSDQVVDAIDSVRGLAGLQGDVLRRAATPNQVMAQYNAVNQQLIEALRLLDGIDTATPEGRQVVGLDAVLRADEAISIGVAWVVIAVATKDPFAIAAHNNNYAALEVSILRFVSHATPAQLGLLALVETASATRLGPGFVADFATAPERVMAGLSLDTLFPAVESLTTLGQFVEKKIVTEVVNEVNARQQRELFTAYLVGGLALLVLAVVALLSTVVARAVARPLIRLTRSAERVARVGEAELVRIVDEEREFIDSDRLDPIDISSNDEIGDLARAFERVQDTATRLVERQVAGRRNVAKMFGHVGRRTQNLVGRQIAMIDQLERDETDPGRLQRLYRLDHVSSRLRRNASSLVVLSGSTANAGGHVAPVALANVVRLALGEIEDYPRVDVRVPLDVSVVPAVTGDLVLVLAELMENATSFSPPTTRVTVNTQPIPAGIRISVIDHGIGISEDRIAEENARLVRRERLDLVPTELLGLFVVGRLARRHGLRVMLSATDGGGITVAIDLESRLLVAGSAETALALARPTMPPAPLRPGGRLTVTGPTRRPSTIIGTTTGRPSDAGTPGTLATRAGALHPAPVAGALPHRVPQQNGLPMRAGADPDDAARVADGPTVTDRALVAGRPATLDTGGAQTVFDPAVLDRATRCLKSGEPWDAFGPKLAAPNALTAGSAPGIPILRQRVPGAQLPESGADIHAVPPTPADPLTVRALVEEFENGVLRARMQAPAPPISWTPPPTQPQGVTAPPRSAGIARPDRLGGPLGTAEETITLTQRVPGASLCLPPPVVRHRATRDPRPPDPEEVRQRFTQFESGIERAQREIRSDQRNEEGSPQ